MPSRHASRSGNDAAALFATAFAVDRDALIVVAQRDGVIVEANAAASQLTGLPRDHLVGLALGELGFWRAPRGEWDEYLHRAGRTSAPTTTSLPFVTHTGRQGEAEVTGRAIEANGELAVLLQITDVTATRERERYLQVVEHKLATVFDAAPDGIALIRRSDGVLIDVNEALCAMSGFRRDDMLGKRIVDANLFADLVAARDALRALDTFGGYRNLPIDLRMANGEVLPTMISASIVDLDGERCVLNQVRDVREQRRAEAALERADRRFRSAFADAPLGIALVDDQLRFSDANRFLTEMLGLAPNAAIGLYLPDIVAEEARETIVHALTELIAGPGPPLHREVRLQCSGAQPRYATLHAIAQHGDAALAPYLIVQLVDITDLRASRAQMERLAFFDPLTQLANRRLYMDRLEQAVQHARRAGSRAALLYLDLDRFKEINDTYGHDVGDELLREVARRLQRSVRAEDTVARLGGDEFAVLLREVRDTGAALQVAQKLLTALRAPAELASHTLAIRASIGVAVLPEDGTEAGLLAQRADRAMYRAKQHGRDTVRCFGDTHSPPSTVARVADSLDAALRSDHLTLLFAPQCQLADNALVSWHVEPTWETTNGRLQEAAQLRATAVATGLARELDLWVVRRGLSQLAALDRGGVMTAGLRFDIAGSQLGDDGFARAVARAADDAGIATARIELAFAETDLARDAAVTARGVALLREHGFVLGIAGFGAAGGVLQLLAALPVQRIELHDSFTQRIVASRESRAMVGAILLASTELQRVVCADGVASATQRDALQTLGVQLGRGDLFGPALGALALLARGWRVDANVQPANRATNSPSK